MNQHKHAVEKENCGSTGKPTVCYPVGYDDVYSEGGERDVGVQYDVEAGEKRRPLKALAQATGFEQFLGFALRGFKGDSHLTDTAISATDLAQFVLQPAGTAEKLELTPFVFGYWKRQGTVPVNRAKEIERLVGRDVVRWECLVSPETNFE